MGIAAHSVVGGAMPTFTTRVELHDADGDDYETLHDAMEARGFTRTIESGDGIVYALPTAEYNIGGALTTDGVLAKAKVAATTTGLQYGVLVTESTGRKWFGLKKAG
jgi:hypothetical protein